jgi:hypothetical protein
MKYNLFVEDISFVEVHELGGYAVNIIITRILSK